MIKFFIKLNSDIFIEIKKFNIDIKKGKIKNQSRIFIKDILKDYRIKSGWIAVNRKKISFSCRIPKTTHQQIKNIIYNDYKYYF